MPPGLPEGRSAVGLAGVIQMGLLILSGQAEGTFSRLIELCPQFHPLQERDALLRLLEHALNSTSILFLTHGGRVSMGKLLPWGTGSQSASEKRHQ